MDLSSKLKGGVLELGSELITAVWLESSRSRESAQVARFAWDILVAGRVQLDPYTFEVHHLRIFLTSDAYDHFA